MNRTLYELATALVLLLSIVRPSAADSVARGEDVYQRCIGCHSLDRNRTGPKHCGLLGRPAGSVEGFTYSSALRESGIIWTREQLDVFLAAPLRAVPETTMGYAGVPDSGDRSDLLAYLIWANVSAPECQGASPARPRTTPRN